MSFTQTLGGNAQRDPPSQEVIGHVDIMSKERIKKVTQQREHGAPTLP